MAELAQIEAELDNLDRSAALVQSLNHFSAAPVAGPCTPADDERIHQAAAHQRDAVEELNQALDAAEHRHQRVVHHTNKADQ